MASEAASDRVRLATYERELPVGEERVWENVHDWEHLPHLHHRSFLDIECLDSGPWGWRVRVGGCPWRSP